MSLYAVALRFPFTGWNTSPDRYSSSTKCYSWYYALGQVAFSWHLPNSDSSIRLPDGEAWFITPENAFPLLQSPMAVSFTPLQPTLGIAQGVFGCSAMETHFLKLPINSSCADVASRGSLELGRECCNRGQTIFTHQSRSVSLCGLPLHSWSVVAPRCFHFTITALTVYHSSFRRAEIWQTDLLKRWHPMTVPRWKSLSSSVRPFNCQCLSMEIAWLCAKLNTPVSNGCGWNRQIY
jgi:hypothetical protein